jgi:large subunit ribosomal protein L22
MEIIAVQKNVRISPRKIRLVSDLIRNQKVKSALNTLSLISKRAGRDVLKAIKSAMANASHNAKMDKNQLTIKRIEISEGQALKRYHPSTRGRVHPYKKRSSHIRIVLTDEKGVA